jgi:hypothetical protein
MNISNVDHHNIEINFENNKIIISNNDIKIIGNIKEAILSFIDMFYSMIEANESVNINFYGNNFFTITKNGLQFNKNCNPSYDTIRFRKEFNRILRTSLVLR